MSKIGFQDGSYGGHLRFLISKILYTFDLQIILLLQCKFQLKLPNGSGADVQKSIFKMVVVVAILGIRSTWF